MSSNSDFSAALKSLRRQEPMCRASWRNRFLLLPRRMRPMLDGMIPAVPIPVIWEVTMIREGVPSLRLWIPAPEDLVARDWRSARPE